ncbi:MAG: hypothetical protein E7C49_03075 [Clostridium sp.]|nr:hypothetical protein [Clostridium sp.]
MEINNFVTTDFLASFTGTLFVVELMVFVTKNLPIIKKVRTRFYTFILALSHIIIMGFVTKTATQTVVYYYSVLINSLIVTVMLCGGYDIIIDKVYSVTNTDSKELANNSTTTKNISSNTEENDEADLNKVN